MHVWKSTVVLYNKNCLLSDCLSNGIFGKVKISTCAFLVCLELTRKYVFYFVLRFGKQKNSTWKTKNSTGKAKNSTAHFFVLSLKFYWSFTMHWATNIFKFELTYNCVSLFTSLFFQIKISECSWMKGAGWPQKEEYLILLHVWHFIPI